MMTINEEGKALVEQKGFNKEEALKEFMDYVHSYLGDDECDQIMKAFTLADKAHEGQFRASGEPYIMHPLAVAEILAHLQIDHITLIAALLHDVVEDTEYTKEDILAFEKEVLGVYVSGHPLDEYAAMWKKHISAMSTDFELDDETGEPKVKVDSKATIGGMIMAKSVKPTKTGQLMAYLTIEDLVGTVEVIVFPRTFSTYRNIIEGTDKLFITGRVNANADENAKLICESVVPFEDVPRKLWIRFASEEEYLKKAADLAEELKYSDGKDSIIIYCTKENKRIALPQSRNIRITPDILASLRAQYGIKNVETT